MLESLDPLVLMALVIVGSLFLIGATAGGIATMMFQVDRERRFAPVAAEQHQRRAVENEAERAQPAVVQISAVSQAIAAEGPTEQPEEVIGLDNSKLGMWIFIASEIMFFTALIGAYIGFRAAGEFTLPEIPTIIPAIGTFILIMSSLTAVLALDSLQRDREVPFILALLGTVVLGIVFLGIQGFEWTELFEKGITPTSDLFGTAFFVLTGFHGLHVAIGLIVLVFVMLRAFLGEFSRERFAGVETFGLYWHFVDIVWIVLFTVIYLIG